jgi:hypothetical protein
MLTTIKTRLRSVLHDTGTATLIFGSLGVFAAFNMQDMVLSQAREGMHLGAEVPLNVIRLTVLGAMSSSVAATALLVAFVSASLRIVIVPAVCFAWAKAMTMRTTRHGAAQRETADVA